MLLNKSMILLVYIIFNGYDSTIVVYRYIYITFAVDYHNITYNSV